MENPGVNPTTGPGRSQQQVARELRNYRLQNRDAEGALPAVFQADFLFVQLQGSSRVQLHRVVHGACIDEAHSPDIQFTTCEYEHLPQRGVSGFFGTFSPKENPHYDVHNKRLGGKFLRHRNVDREAVKVYNVSVQVVTNINRQSVRVRLCSLQKLAEVCDAYALPDPLPPTHSTEDSSNDEGGDPANDEGGDEGCLLYTSPSPRD